MSNGLTNAPRIFAALALLQLAACGKENQYVAAPPPKVTAATPTKQPVIRYLEATGNAVAVNTADLVARVSGFLERIDQKDGDLVTKGTVLFTIEREPYRVRLEQAKAAQASTAATLKQTQEAFQRQATLVTQQSVSQAQYDQALANRDNAQGSFNQALANTQLAQINYDYTQVTAPFDGIVTARQASIGQYVGGAGTPTVLATIVQLNPIYVNFNINERDVIRVREEIVRRGLTPNDIKKMPVEIGLQNETGYPHVGAIDYAAPSVDQSTGTLLARAILENADQLLLPGYFARVRVPFGEAKDALLVPDVAIGSDQGGRYLLIVGKDNVVEQRKVEAGPLVGDMRVIETGLAAGDRVIIGGVMRAIPGQKVDPQAPAAPAAVPR